MTGSQSSMEDLGLSYENASKRKVLFKVSEVGIKKKFPLVQRVRVPSCICWGHDRKHIQGGQERFSHLIDWAGTSRRFPPLGAHDSFPL